ncbi:hypothetical protein [Glaciimonas soli]|uniref:hypothetical protein n=1 Tax=Glaciimonas soli TaxID=2590999 RepID=UPI001293087F|nr:hypothetical protein [Glaciimonas soli]
MSIGTPIHGATMHEFEEALKRGFAKMYAQSRVNDTEFDANQAAIEESSVGPSP